MLNDIGLFHLKKNEGNPIANEPHSFLTRDECSLLQRMRVHISQIFNTCMLRISQFFAGNKQDHWYRAVSITDSTPELRNQIEITVSAANLRNHGQQLTATTLLTYLKKCGSCLSIDQENDQEKKVILVETYLLPSPADNQQNLLEEVREAIELAKTLKKDYIAIPVVCKGTSTNHIVAILIKFDHKNHKATIEFFDSMGFLPGSYKKNGLSLEDLIVDQLTDLIEKKFLEHTDYSVSHETTPIIIQKEKVNCGVYVAKRIKMLTDGKESIERRNIEASFGKINIEETRESMAKELDQQDTKEIRSAVLKQSEISSPQPISLNDNQDDFYLE
jgi:hypothetical protein